MAPRRARTAVELRGASSAERSTTSPGVAGAAWWAFSAARWAFSAKRGFLARLAADCPAG
eukprot:2876464-Alexandrium_andersonii.AAC.1